MSRLITVHPLRTRLDLNGLWDFQIARMGAVKPPRAGYQERQEVPGVWESALAHFDHRSQGWYRRSFTLAGSRAADVRLVFEAVSHTGKVWLDGRFLGEHYGAHNQFEFIVPALAPGTHELAVLVDNSFGAHNPLTAPYQDIYTWGGIPRPVFAETLPDIAIIDAKAMPMRLGDGSWELDCSARLRLAEGGDLPATVVVGLDGHALGALKVRRDGTAAGRLRVDRPKLWSCATPHLSLVSLSVIVDGDAIDAWQERIGFRTIRVAGRQILLNDRPIALVGVNRHEFHPDFGPALPATIHLRDIEILKKLGANYVRGAHYPNDHLWLDLCDEHGLLFWEETSHWQPKEEHLRDPLFRRRSLEQATEMVVQHRHHPSIFTWGFLNETDSHLPAARPVVKELVKRIKGLDPTRPTTFASMKYADDRCLDLVDIVSINIYPGWYWSDLASLPSRLDEILAATRRRSHGKPIIISEFGAGAMDGVRSFETRKWTEGFQADLLRLIIGQVQDSGFVTGLSIWQYCDVRTSDQLALSRIREYNNKGIVTEYREPKAAFAVVQDVFKRRWRILDR